MSHPLSRLIFENTSFSAKELDTIITTYLRERADLLKKKIPDSYRGELIDLAFELSEKCECEIPFTPYSNVCGRCGKDTNKPSLPSKIDYVDLCHCEYGDTDKIIDYLIVLAKKINALIDLHTKEAREG